MFLSQRVGQSYGGYAKDQFQRLEATRRKTGQIRWKQAMHMLRLLLAGEHVLRTGDVLVDVSDHRGELLAVKRGERSWDEIRAWASALEQRLRDATARTRLPAEPDRLTISDFLVRTRRAHV